MIGYSEMLQEELEDLDQVRLVPDVEKINAAGRHLLGLINDILDLSKIEAGKMELFLEPVDLAGLIRDVATTVGPLMAKNANSLVVDLQPNLGTIRADATKLRQILFNLLGNAAKFTDHGTITLSVLQGSALEAEDARRLEVRLDRVDTEGDAGRLGLGPDRIDTEGDAGRLGLEPDRVDTWEPAPTRPPAVGAGSQLTTSVWLQP